MANFNTLSSIVKMAPKKRVVTTVKETNNNCYKNLTLNNVLCPICRNIFVEPVTLPCSHGFCKPCFEGTLENANLTCPLCRVRFASWHRLAKKENKIVNEELWTAVKHTFPKQVKNRLEGVEENLDEDERVVVRVASPGAIRREYEAQREREEKERQLEHEKETKASELLIKKLREQEEYEETVREEKLKHDELIAKKLAAEFGTIPKEERSKIIHKAVMANKLNNLDKFMMNRQKNAQLILKPVKIPQSQFLNGYKNKTVCHEKIGGNSNKNSKNSGVSKYINKSLNSTPNENIDSDKNEIEDECKYFKPLDPNKPSIAFKMSLKVTAKILKASDVQIRPPSGKMEFRHITTSPFVCFKPPPKRAHSPDEENEELTAIENKILPFKTAKKLKTQSIELYEMFKEKSPTLPTTSKKPCIQETKSTKCSITNSVVFPSTSYCSSEASCSSWSNRNSISPPFRGFPIKNDVNSDMINAALQKSIQEKRDREFALRLHEQLNSNGRLNSIRNNQIKKRKRQVTLEELVK